MAFNDPYFAVKAATSNAITDLKGRRDNVIFPLVETLILRQSRVATSVAAAAAAASSSSAHESKKAPGMVIDCSDLQGQLASFEEELTKIQKSLQFIEKMLASIRSGVGGLQFSPSELVARQRFFETCTEEKVALGHFLDTCKDISNALASGVIPSRFFDASSGLPHLVQAQPSGGGGVSKPPPSILPTATSAVSGAIALQNIKNAARERQLAEEKNRKWAEEVHLKDNDNFIQAHQEQQREEEKLQAKALDRIAFHVGEMKHSVVAIREEVGTQEVMLEEQLTRTERLKGKIAALNKQVDHLIENMSNCSKIMTIIGLMLVLITLIVIF